MHMFIRFCSLTLTPPKLCLTFGNASPVDLFTFELNSLGRAPYIHTRPAVQKLQYTHCQDCHNLIIMFSATHVHAVVPTPVSFWFCSFHFLHTSSCCKEHCAHCSWCALEISIIFQYNHYHSFSSPCCTTVSGPCTLTHVRVLRTTRPACMHSPIQTLELSTRAHSDSFSTHRFSHSTRWPQRIPNSVLCT